MRLSDFDFDLPESLIALRPAVPRDAARLLVVSPPSQLDDRLVSDLPALLRPGDAIVFNDTRVGTDRWSRSKRRSTAGSRPTAGPPS
jgi:S-adenosylmethionine:tRNA ribosyltransferase-isomerase